MADLAERLFAEILAAVRRHEPDTGSGWEPRQGWRNSHRHRARDRALGALARLGLARPRFDPEQAARTLAELAPLLEGLEQTYRLLADERSRETLVRVLALRVLGPRHVRPPVTLKRFWGEAARVEAELRQGPAPGPVPQFGRYRVPGREGDLTLLGLPTQVVEFFVLEQYAYRHGGHSITAEPGDVVLDGGSGLGDTALYFADRAGERGRVVALEFAAANLEWLRENLDANPRLAERVQVVEAPLWVRPGEELRFDSAFGRTSVLAGEGAESVRTTSVDELVESGVVERVDFLKLDVEGAEPKVLRGAEQTLRRFSPKLAISAYHRLEDLVELPRFVEGLGLGYSLFLDHFLPSPDETILFAQAAERSGGRG